MSMDSQETILVRPMTLVITLTTMVMMGLQCTACGGRTMIHAGPLNTYDKQNIVDMHNKMRQSVALGLVPGQPPAARMLEMRWDEGLARRALEWATTCYWQTHDPYLKYKAGQNIAEIWKTKIPSSTYEMEPNFGDAIGMWFHEVTSFRYGGFNTAKIGHYTQMVWGDTASIGCGFAFYFESHSKRFTKKYVCNYGPSGNVKGELPYQKGYPNCFTYGLSESRKYSGLCDTSNNNIPKSFDFHNYIG